MLSLLFLVTCILTLHLLASVAAAPTTHSNAYSGAMISVPVTKSAWIGIEKSKLVFLDKLRHGDVQRRKGLSVARVGRRRVSDWRQCDREGNISGRADAVIGHVESGCTGVRTVGWWAVITGSRLAASADAAGLLRLVGFVSFVGGLLSSSITAAVPGFKYPVDVYKGALEIVRSCGGSGTLQRLRRLAGCGSLGRGGKRSRHGCRATEQCNDAAMDDDGGIPFICMDWVQILFFSAGKCVLWILSTLLCADRFSKWKPHGDMA